MRWVHIREGFTPYIIPRLRLVNVGCQKPMVQGSPTKDETVKTTLNLLKYDDSKIFLSLTVFQWVSR